MILNAQPGYANGSAVIAGVFAFLHRLDERSKTFRIPWGSMLFDKGQNTRYIMYVGNAKFVLLKPGDAIHPVY